MKARYGFVTLAALLLGCAAPTSRPAGADQLIRVSEDLQIRRIDPDVWVHTSWHVLADQRRLSSNGLIVRDGAQLMLIDTGWGVAPTQELVDWIARDLQLPIAGLIPTHHHDDRIGGWPVLATLGVPLLATPQTLSLSADADITQTLDPVLTTLSENQTLAIGAVEVFAPGPAHSPDNLMVWLPAQAILFGGCAIKAADATRLGNIDEADFRGWPLAIQRAQQRYPQARVVVPGHGEPGDRSLLSHTLDLLKAETPAAK
jgi:metallo-beta-lactamase class B